MEPPRDWTGDNQCCFNWENKPHQQGLSPANRPQACARGGVEEGAISDSERQKKAERLGSERWPRVYLPRQAWRRSGGPSTAVLMNVNLWWGGQDFR